MTRVRKAALPVLVGALLSGCAKTSGAQTGPVARVDGQAITEAELAAEARAPLAAAEARHAEEIHALKARALDVMIEKRLLEARAKKEGLSVDALLARDIAARVPEPTEEYVRSVYDQTKANGKVVPPYEASKADIVRFVKGQTFEGMRQGYVARLRAEAKVESLLPPYLPPKVDVKAEGPSKGDPKAPVTIVEFSDYECNFCGGVEPTVQRVLASYPDKVRLVYQSFPLSIHPHAPKAAEAALCADEQGKYWEMHQTLFAHQNALGIDDIKGYAKTIGLDAAKFGMCLDSGRTAGAVEAQRKAGEALGLDSTPSFFINGRLIAGSQPFEKFQSLIDYELGTAGH